MQASLEHHDDEQVERMKRQQIKTETLDEINLRRAAAGLPPLVPYVPAAPKSRRRRQGKQ